MLGNLIFDLQNLDYLLHSPIMWIGLAFQIWMLVDAIRRQEWIWAIFIFFFSFITAIFYYFFVYRASRPAAVTPGFELPGASERKRIKDLEGQIHHLDKAHHHFQLGDVYFQQGKFTEAEACYRAALEREPEDIDTRAHLGQCLLRLNRPQEARPLLQAVCQEDPKHDYGHTLMAFAETLGALGETDSAIDVWKHVTENHAYARARVQLAELYHARNQPDLAREQLQEVLEDAPHTPAFQKRRDRYWVKRAGQLLRKLQA